MPTPRIAHWHRALVAWAESLRGAPYVWGRTDCAALVRGAWTVIFGGDPWAALPRWRTPRGALRVLARGGGIDVLLTQVGAQSVPQAYAQAGDVLVFDDPQEPGHAIGFAIAVPPGRWLTSTPAAGVYLGRAPAGQCWRPPPHLVGSA